MQLVHNLQKQWIAVATVVALVTTGLGYVFAPNPLPAPKIVRSALEWNDGYAHYILTPAAAVDVAADSATRRTASEAFANTVSQWTGVVDATPMTDGLVSVRTTLSEAAIAGHAEVATTAPNDLLALTSVSTGAPNDPAYATQWALKNTGAGTQASGYVGTAGDDTGAPAAWATTTGNGIIVADIDTGVDIDHVDLAANIWHNPGETCGNGTDDDHNGFIDDCNGWDTADNDNDPRPDGATDIAGHGTHVAGIIGAVGDNNNGIVGVAPNVKVMPIKIAHGDNLSFASVYTAIHYAVDNGAKVINASWGSGAGYPRSSVAALESAIAYAQAHGVLFVVAAGNDNIDLDASPSWPASFSQYYDNVLTVGASTNNDTRASFSDYGKSTVGIYAPGFFIMSTLPNNNYGFMSGTSMASPVVAGGAADVLAADPSMTPASLIARMQSTADSRPELNDTAQAGRFSVAQAIVPSALEVTYRGFGTAQPDTDFTGFADIHLGTDAAAAGVEKLRLTVVTADDGSIYSVGDLPVTSKLGAVTRTASTNANGTVDVLISFSSAQRAAFRSGVVPVQLTTNLPAGLYTFALQLNDANGVAIGNASLIQVLAGDHSIVSTPTTTDAPTTDTPGTGSDVNSGSGDGSGGTGDSGGDNSGSDGSGGSGSSATTVGASPSDPNSTNETTTPTTTTVTTFTPTTAPDVTTTTAPDSSGSGSTGTTTGPAGNGSNPGLPVSDPGDPSDSSGGSSGDSPSTTTVLDEVSSTPTTTPTTATTMPADPTPAPVSQSGWTITSVAPRTGGMAGGELVTISGTFLIPSQTYVAIGGLSAVITMRGANTLLVIAPPHAAGLVGVTISQGSSISLAMAGAYRYLDPNNPSAGYNADSAADAGSSNGSTTTTTAATAGGPTTTTITRGALTLTKVGSGHPLYQLSANGWANTVCAAATCPGRPFVA